MKLREKAQIWKRKYESGFLTQFSEAITLDVRAFKFLFLQLLVMAHSIFEIDTVVLATKEKYQL